MGDTMAVAYGKVSNRSDSPCTGVFTMLVATAPGEGATARINVMSLERAFLERGVYRVTVERVADDA